MRVTDAPPTLRPPAGTPGRAVLFAGGGSGGHIAPGLAIAERLPRERHVVFACSERPVDTALLAPSGFAYFTVPMTPPSLRPRAIPRTIRSIWRSVRRCAAGIREHDVGRVVTLGGFVALPAVLAARRARVPVLLVNLDDPPGRANRRLARWADDVWTARPLAESPGFAARTVGFPVRRAAVAEARDAAGRARARATLGLDPDRPALLVTGASQGSNSLNQMIAHLLRTRPDAFRGWQAIHLTGHDADTTALAEAYAGAEVPVLLESFTTDMGVAWGAAELALSRAGASSVAEVALNAVPTLFLPYPYHEDRHQWRNAAPLVDRDAALIAEDHVDPERNAADAGRHLVDLLGDPARRSAIRTLLETPRPADGAEEIAAAL